MGGFKFEDYRQPWETGPHWELKREFMEKYSDTFAEDRLLCLAQAYSNIVLMNCSYPDPVMRQISLLAKPLEMRKKFQRGTDTSEGETAQNQDQRGEKMKAIYQKSGRPFKQIKFCSSKESQADEQQPQESKISSANLSQETTSTLSSTSISVAIQQQPKIISNAKDSKSIDEAKSDEINMIGSSDKKIYDNKIVGCLGIEVIQNFAQIIKTLMFKKNDPLSSIQNAAQNLKMREMINFKIDLKPNSSAHAPIYCCQFTINNCLISSEEANNKKTAKAKSAKAAADLLMKLASDVSFQFKCNNAVKSEVQNRSVNIAEEPMVNISHGNCTKQVDPDETHKEGIEILQKLFANVRPAINPFVSLNRASKKLNIGKCLEVKQSKCSQTSQYVYELFFKDILIASVSTNCKRKHNIELGEIALSKLKDLSNCEIQNGELKKKITDQLDKIELVTNMNYATEVQKLPLVLNLSLFSSSKQDEFVLVDNLSRSCLKTARSVLSDSASFCHKQFGYNFDILPEGNIHKAEILIGDMVVGCGMSLVKEVAKLSACSSALEILRKRYYTLQLKPLQNDSSISRNQVYDAGASSSDALTDSNIGCKMLKSMGWSGGGLGTSGIAEPVGIDAQHNFKKGLGFAMEGGDYSVFKRRINSLLRDLSDSNSLDDLLFSKEFSKEERKHIHQIARKYKLHTVSRGLDDERFLAVRRKYSINDILSHLEKVGGSDRKFQLLDASTDELNPFVFTEST